MPSPALGKLEEEQDWRGGRRMEDKGKEKLKDSLGELSRQ